MQMKSLLFGLTTLMSLSFVGVADDAVDPALRNWTSDVGSTIEARVVSYTGKKVTLVTTDAKKRRLTLDIKKLSEEDQAWLEEHKKFIGKPASQWASQPSGPLAEGMKGHTYKLVDGKFEKQDAKLSAQYFICYFSASWCGPCRMNAPHSVKDYNELVANNPKVEVVMCSCDHTMEKAQAWAAKENMPWPLMMEADYSKISFINAVSPRGIPTMVLLDKDGNKIATGRHIGDLLSKIK